MASGLALVWFAIGLVGTAIGAIASLGAGWTEPDPWKRRFYQYAAVAAGVMAAAYLLAVLGVGRLAIDVGDTARPVFWTRELAWAIVAALTLLALGRLADADETPTNRAAALGAGVPVATLLAAVLPSSAVSIGIYVLAGAFLIGVLYLTFGPIGAQASRRHQTVASTYRSVRTTIAAALAANLAVGVAGSPAVDALAPGTTLPLFLAIDVVGVVLAGFLLCRSRAVLHWARPESPSVPDDADADSTAD
jgi:bacteriorhodopsin